ncbi:NUB1 protein, partial [Amia calva]|nr:NUB1 protein [Amia calva]
MKLILSGKQLVPGKTLEQQNVKHNSKIMVLEVNETEKKKMAVEEEKQRSQTESLKRTKKAFQILSERDGSVDPETTPFLEIADQKGNPITIPEVERRALILAMGLHEKGRALMKRKQYEAALNHLLQADEQFSKCGSQLLNSVDNYAVLQLDVAWCYRTLKSLECLTDAKQRLQTAETCFLKCYGERRERLLQIKGSTGREEVLFLRLYLLQGLVAYTEGNDQATERLLKKAEDLYGQLCLDTGKMMELMALGFTEQEARLGLRACHGNLNEAATHISQRREEKEKLRREEREKRRRRVESINTLREMGYSKKDAAKALHRTQGDLDKAFLLLLDSFQPVEAANNNRGSEDSSDPDRRDMIEQLVSLGFERGASEAALRFSGGNIQVASQLLAHHEGNLPPDILSPSPPSSLSEEPSTSSESTGYVSPGEDQMEVDLVNEVLDDIPKHEEDYLDLTLEEESEAMAQLKSYLDRGHRSQD